MGIYDRDYYRDSSGGFHPFDSRIQACICLALSYIAVFLVVAGTREPGDLNNGPVYQALVLDSDRVVLHGEVWRLVTYAFACDPNRYISIAMSILFLFWIGRHVEDIYGWKEFLAFYLSTGILAGTAYVLVSAVEGGQQLAWAGPSGSVTAVLFLFALHYPTRTVCYYVPIWFVVGFYVLLEVLSSMRFAVFAGYAAAAGFAVAYHMWSLRVSNWLPGLPLRKTTDQRPKTKLQIYRDRPAVEGPVPSAESSNQAQPIAVTAPSSERANSDIDEQLEAKLDQVLEKVKKHGQDSLSDEERAVLFRASEIYRKRRKQIGD